MKPVLFLLAVALAACDSEDILRPLETGIWCSDVAVITNFADHAELKGACRGGITDGPVVLNDRSTFDMLGDWAISAERRASASFSRPPR